MKQRAPTVVWKLCEVPRLIVVYSRMMVPAPISTQVSSPLNLRSCGSPPRIEPSPTCTSSARRTLRCSGDAGPEPAAVAHRDLRPDHHPRADLDPVAQLGAEGSMMRRRVDAGGHRSTTRAIISASATTLPST